MAFVPSYRFFVSVEREKDGEDFARQNRTTGRVPCTRADWCRQPMSSMEKFTNATKINCASYATLVNAFVMI